MTSPLPQYCTQKPRYNSCTSTGLKSSTLAPPLRRLQSALAELPNVHSILADKDAELARLRKCLGDVEREGGISKHHLHHPGGGGEHPGCPEEVRVAEIEGLTQMLRELEARLKNERERHAREVEEFRWSSAVEVQELRSELASVRVRCTTDPNKRWRVERRHAKILRGCAPSSRAPW